MIIGKYKTLILARYTKKSNDNKWRGILATYTTNNRFLKIKKKTDRKNKTRKMGNDI